MAQTSGHGGLLTNSAQWGRVGENGYSIAEGVPRMYPIISKLPAGGDRVGLVQRI